MSTRKTPRAGKVTSLEIGSHGETEDCASAKESARKRRKPTALQGAETHFVVESAESQAAVYEFFGHSNNLAYTTGLDPFSPLNRTPATDVYIVFCASPLGPCAPGSLANTLSV